METRQSFSPGLEDIQFTAFTEGKIRWWFGMLDVDKDGLMSQGDFHLIADRFVKEYDLTGEKALEIRDWLTRGWEIVLDMDKDKETEQEMRCFIPLVIKMGEDLQVGKKISQDDFTQAFGQLIQHSPALAKSTLQKMVSAFFDIFDHDRDGFIMRDEMVVAMRCFGYDDPDMVEMAFASMDLDKDDRLSRKEYIDGWLNFILGQDKQHAFVATFAPHLTQL
ncbi:unnamed protein product [Lymnaea stagnalis]|uniref:EF-hand domain-containing protein n=1 Tax=Lymnaea stagnalis TaxID=6523 RepID=A0AAV2IHA0_LYMST